MSSNFDVNNKVALITGGAQGLGLIYARELLKNGLKGAVIGDVDVSTGEKSVKELNDTFGNGKALFVKLDVTNKVQFEDAFKKTVEHYGNVDILINNAGILNDSIWEKEIQININGVIHGMILAVDNYLKNFKSDKEAVVVNACSIAGVSEMPFVPVYSATKFAIMGITKAWGHSYHLNRTGVRTVAICPGPTDTTLMQLDGKYLSPEYQLPADFPLRCQKAEDLGEKMVRIIKKAPNGTLWVCEDDEEPYEFVLPERTSFKSNKLIE